MKDDTVTHVARLTAPGRGAVASLRVEGPQAAAVVAAEFASHTARSLESCFGDGLLFGRFGPPPAEEVVVCPQNAMAVDVHCHGGDAAVERIIECLVARGCRADGWRGWIERRYSDPIRQAAAAALAEARTRRTALVLLDQFHGALGAAISEIIAAFEEGRIEDARRQLDALRSRAGLGRHLIVPWRVVFAGRPNAGKSSLLNALVGFDRAIVDAAPGTTRDAVAVSTAVDGWPVQFFDTAGLRASDDMVEAAGVAMARRQIVEADLVVVVWPIDELPADELSTDELPADELPADELSTDEETGERDGRALLAATRGIDARSVDHVPLVAVSKCDLAAAALDRANALRASLSSAGSRGLDAPAVVTSAHTGSGLDELLAAIARRLVPSPPPPGSAVPWTDAQIAALTVAADFAAAERHDDAAGALRAVLEC